MTMLHEPKDRRGGGNPTYQRALGEHGERPKRGIVNPHGPEVDGATRPHGGILLEEEIVQQPRLHQRHGVSLFMHLEDAEPPLHEGDDPPVVELGEDRGRRQPVVCQHLQDRGQPD
jgi:hypothetical protein